jgi:hypothetical protein
MGLAHDFCNIMTGIVALSETFESELGGNASLRDGLNMIRSTAIEAGQLTQRIRQLHRKPRAQAVDIHKRRPLVDS